MTTLSIVIPVYNGGEKFQKCLDSIKHSLGTIDEVIVVCDGDTDGSWQVAKDFGAKVLRLASCGGPARARNLGAKAAKGELLFFMDADVTIHPQTLDQIKQQFQQEPSLSALIGSYDDTPGAENFLSQYKNLFHHYTHQVSSEVASTFWGACGAIRRSAFAAVGGFDESYRHPCIEDIELGYRLKREGYSIRLCKEIQVKHLKQWEPISLLKAEIFYRAIPWTELMLRDRCLQNDLNLSYSNRVSVVLAFALIQNLTISFFIPWLFFLSLGLGIILLFLNFNVYRFFYQKRGFWFTLQVIPWHWFYFLYGGAAFAYATGKHYVNVFTLAHKTTAITNH